MTPSSEVAPAGGDDGDRAARTRATIADVAALAGVSVPTVSRVLTGAARVSPIKRERVNAAIAHLNYRPSAAARVLVSRRTRVIAIIAGDTSRYGYATTIRGIEEAARAEGYTVMITVVESDDDDEVERATAVTLAQPLAGAIVLKFDAAGVAMLRRLPKSLPVVALSGVRESGLRQAVLDESAAAEELTEHLLSLGHRTVHHAQVPPARREDPRTAGWRRALRRAGREVPPILRASWQPSSGVEIGRILARDERATAVFCGNDEIAIGVIHGLRTRGVRVPDDMSVAGFDDHPLAEFTSPPLTTVDQDFAALGRRGFTQLRAAIDGDDGPLFTSERPPLVLRQSVAPPRLSALRLAPPRPGVMRNGSEEPESDAALTH